MTSETLNVVVTVVVPIGLFILGQTLIGVWWAATISANMKFLISESIIRDIRVAKLESDHNHLKSTVDKMIGRNDAATDCHKDN
jgi:hypothetical protein